MGYSAVAEAFPYDTAPNYLIFDRGAQFNEEVIDTVKSFGIEPKRISFRSPWQNGVAERWVGNCRRDLLNHVIVVNERHLKRLMNEYVRRESHRLLSPVHLLFRGSEERRTRCRCFGMECPAMGRCRTPESASELPWF